MGTTVMPTTPEDFHGDGGQGEVAIVRAHRELGLEMVAPVGQPALEQALIGTNMGLSFMPGIGPQAPFLETSLPPGRGSISSYGEPLPFLRAGSTHPGELLFGAVADVLSTLLEDSLYGSWRDAEDIRDAAGADPSSVLSDDVVSIESQSFRGHVYNLQTESGRYVANGIINHNCRSSLTPITKSWRELGIPAKELAPGTRASMNGQVPADTTYNQWLRGRVQAGDMGTVREALGPSRAKLFAAGGLDVTAFTDRRGRLFTLEQLRRREPDVFERFNIRVPTRN